MTKWYNSDWSIVHANLNSKNVKMLSPKKMLNPITQHGNYKENSGADLFAPLAHNWLILVRNGKILQHSELKFARQLEYL